MRSALRFAVFALLLLGCVLLCSGCGNRIGSAVSNGTYTIKVVSAERKPMGPGLRLDVVCVMVDIAEAYRTDTTVKNTAAVVLDSKGEQNKTKDCGIDKQKALAYFVFVVEEDANKLRFRFGDFPDVKLH